MAIQYGATLRTDRLTAIQTRVATAGGTALLKLFSGADPANCAAADPSGVLCTINLPTTFLTASGGTTTIAGSWTQASASGAGLPGTAACFRIYDSAGTCHLQGTVTATGGGGDLTLNSASIAAGQTVTVTAVTINAANA